MTGADGPWLQVPDGFDIFTAEFGRDGDNLLVAAEGSPPLTVVDYFAASPTAALVAPNGSMLTGGVVELLAGPRAPGQYAQAGDQQGATPIGQVETLSGSSSATRLSGETVELGQGDPVFQGDVIQTGSDSNLGIRLEDGTLASLSSQSRLVLNEFVYEADGSDNWMLVDLVEGAFAFLTGAIAPSGGMEITTPVAVMAIRGTMPIAIVAQDGASQFFAGSDKQYELLHLTTKELLAVISSGTGYALGSPDATLQTIDIDPETLDEINNLLDVLNDAAASLGFLGIQTASGFHAYSPFGSIDDLGALMEFLQLLEGALAEEAVLDVEDSDQFLMAEATLVASPDQAVTGEMSPVLVDVLDNDSHPEGDELTVVFADVPNGQGSVTIVDGKSVLYDPGTAFDYLALGETTDVVITYAISDTSGAIASSTVTVTLTGINQAPVVVAQTTDASATVNELADTSGSNFQHVADGTVSFADVDLSDTHSASAVADGPNYLGSFVIGAVDQAGNTLGWTFTVTDADLDSLGRNATLTQTYTVTIDDGHGGTVEQVVTITIDGTNDAPVIVIGDGDSASADLEEHDGGLQADGTLTVVDVSVNDVVTAEVTAVVASGDHNGVIDNAALLEFLTVSSPVLGSTTAEGTLVWTFNSNGEAFDFLADGQKLVLTYTVVVDDGTATSNQTVTITIAGTNDLPVISVTNGDSATAGLDETDSGLAANGTLSVSDLDISDVVAAEVTQVTASGDQSTQIANSTLLGFLTVATPVIGSSATAGTLNWAFDSGSQAFDFLAKGEELVLTYTVRIDDGNGGTDTQAVTVTITGTNDAPLIVGASTDASGAVTELANTTGSSTDRVDGGTITFADADLSDTHSANFAPNANGYIGSFSLGAINQNANTVGWTFTVEDGALDHLAAGETLTQSYTVTVSDGNGGTVQQVVNVTITGTNDAPVTNDVSGLSGFVGDAIEITLSGSDVDGTVNAFKITTPPTGGGLFLDANGQTPVDPNNIPASGNEATIYFIPERDTKGDVSFKYAAVDDRGAQDQTPATVDLTVDTATIYLMISQDTWQGGADLPTFDGFQVTVAGITYDLADLTVVDSNFYGQNGTDGFTLGVGIGSGNKERYVVFEIDGVPGGASTDISFDYKVTDPQGETTHDGIRFYAGTSQTDLDLVFDADNHSAFTGNDKNVEFSPRVLSFNYALIAGALAVDNVELTAPLDPIVLDLSDPGLDLSGTASFDLNADSEAETLAWTGGEDAILAMDLDGSGAIESGNEVFSPFFNGGGFADALEALASLDANGDGAIDAKDEAFADLLAWVDANSDGESQSDELVSLAELGVVSFDLDAEGVDYLVDGQRIIAEGQFTKSDGTTGDYAAVELDEILASPEPLVSDDDSGGSIDEASKLFALKDLSIHDVIADYREGDVVDLTQLGFALATGQLSPDAAAEFVRYDAGQGALSVDVHGSGDAANFKIAAEFASPPPSVLVRLTDGDSVANVEIA